MSDRADRQTAEIQDMIPTERKSPPHRANGRGLDTEGGTSMRDKLTAPERDEARLIDVGNGIEHAVQEALAALEENGIPADEADEFVRESVFNAWTGWDYEVPAKDET